MENMALNELLINEVIVLRFIASLRLLIELNDNNWDMLLQFSWQTTDVRNIIWFNVGRPFIAKYAA